MRKLITRLFEPKDNAAEAAYLLAQLMGAKISRSTLDRSIKGHPNYPSFLSISDVLNTHGIENLTARFDKDKFPELPTPFITQVYGKKEVYQYTVVKEIDKNKAHYYDPEVQSWISVTLDDFTEKSLDNILMADIEEPVTEKDYEKKIAEEKRIKRSQTLMIACPPILLLCSVIFAFFSAGSTAILASLYATLILAGVAITSILLFYEVDQTNSVLQDICMAGKKLNCTAILRSKAAKIWGISWSTIGFVYFTGSLTLLLLSGLTNIAVLNILSWFTLAATPYVFYSVYYQWRVAQQWCVLCLSVQLVLALQCMITFLGNWHEISVFESANSVGLIISALFAFAIPFITVTISLPALRKADQYDHLNQELQRLKHSPEIFTAILEKQKPVEFSTEGLGITMGNPNGSIKIIKVCNPYCGPCARAHTPIEELLHNNPDLQVQIIFNAKNADHDIKAHPVRHFLAIDQKKESDLIHRALDDWYLAEKKDYKAFAEKYPMNGELKMQGEKIEAMRDWCDKTEIRFTPTFFVNGFQLPSSYSVYDLKYFLSV